MGFINMNKNDIKLIVILIIVSVFSILILKLRENNNLKVAKVYYNDKLVLTIDLNIKEEKTYNVEGFNGSVEIIAYNGKVKVSDEISPLNLCSKQGYISKSYESIVCLPNKIVIKIEDNEQLDTVIK